MKENFITVCICIVFFIIIFIALRIFIYLNKFIEHEIEKEENNKKSDYENK